MNDHETNEKNSSESTGRGELTELSILLQNLPDYKEEMVNMPHAESGPDAKNGNPRNPKSPLSG